ncbi:MAG TPA: arsenic-transporting ATPase [Candidatus Aenigmarchaeota archaeon]|nr:arsenic-transporting ATPase [Candidatus Aenigmarchaeota archaeon]
MLKNPLNRKKRETRYYFFSGKGGVGKTSIAAATALWFSRNGKKTLIISTDPAHSLSDSFKRRIGGEIKKLDRNLYAIEIDPRKAVKEYKEKLLPEIERMDFLKGLGLDETFDIAGMTPGIDEVASFDKFLQYMSSTEYDVIVFDTAPTGHTLRFLSLPDVLDSWIGKIIKIRLGFSGMINMMKKILPFGNPGECSDIDIEHLETMKKRIKQAKEILSDEKKTQYSIVMIPEAMSIYESERCVKTLREYGIPVKNVIINQIIPDNSRCDFCRAKRNQQVKRIRVIERIFKGYRILKLELFREEIRGMKMLEKVGKKLYG